MAESCMGVCFIQLWDMAIFEQKFSQGSVVTHLRWYLGYLIIALPEINC